MSPIPKLIETKTGENNANNLECDFCNIFIENDGEGSAFCNGTAFSNIGFDDRIACPDCIDYLNEGECNA